MFGPEIALALAAVALLGSSLKEWKKAKSHRKISSENSQMHEVVSSILDDADIGGEFDHVWGRPQDDVIYSSFSPFNNSVVVVKTSMCKNCHIVHRHIVRGFDLAQKRSLNVEGFYASGIKVVDKGCPGANKVKNKELTA